VAGTLSDRWRSVSTRAAAGSVTVSACISIPAILTETQMKELIATHADSDGTSCRRTSKLFLTLTSVQ